MKNTIDFAIGTNNEIYLQNEIFSIVNKNTKFLNETKNNIDRLSENFIDKFYYTVLFILVLTVVFILILSIKDAKLLYFIIINL